MLTRRQITKTFLDLFLWVSSLPLGYVLRTDFQIDPYIPSIAVLMLISLPIQCVLFYLFQFQNQSWHRISTKELPQIIFPILVWSCLLYFPLFISSPKILIPRSVPIISGLLAILFLLGLRIFYRVYLENQKKRKTIFPIEKVKKVIVIGAGEAGTLLVREMLRHPESFQKPIGFLDDDLNKKRTKIYGLPVLGNIDQLEEVSNLHKIDEILIAVPSASGKFIRRIVERAQKTKIPYKIMPGLFDLLSGKVSISELREVNIDDLLRREPVELKIQEISQYLHHKTVLITGAGGSIGSELVRQVLKFDIKKIILFGRGENSIYLIEQMIKRLFPHVSYQVIIGDVRDKRRLDFVFKTYSPQIVFHAAAHKHVPLMEANVDEAILNNVIGTKNLVELALKYKIERFVNISTDKAVNPTSVMGATKRIAELITKVAANQTSNQAFVSVRFGNVLGSRGSVVPTFKEQIKNKQPLTITHAEMTRYFMTIPEAAQLVLQASAMADNGAVYVLNMGQPIKILDLAEDLIKLSGFTPHLDIGIIYTGLRPGEKLFEELLTAEEGIAATRHPQISVAKKSNFNEVDFEENLNQLIQAALNLNSIDIKILLKKMIPTYQTSIPESLSLESK